jgi:hypothetical protein
MVPDALLLRRNSKRAIDARTALIANERGTAPLKPIAGAAILQC